MQANGDYFANYIIRHPTVAAGAVAAAAVAVAVLLLLLLLLLLLIKWTFLKHLPCGSKR